MISSYASRAAASAAARSAGRSERTSSSSPVTGWVRRSSAACRNCRSRPSSRAVAPTPGRPRPGGRSRPGGRGSGGCGRPERHPQERAAVERLDQLELGDRVARPVGLERHPGRIAAITADGRLDAAAARAGPAAHERNVRPADVAPPQLRLQAGVGAGIAGHKQESGRVPVEPVDDARAAGIAARTGARQRIHQGRCGVAGHGVHEQARGLVDHHQVLVGVRHGHAETGRRRAGRRRFRLGQGHERSRVEPVRLRPGGPVDQDPAGFDQPLSTGPRADIRMRRNEAVEAHTAGVRRHPQLDHGSSSSGGRSASAGAGAARCSTRISPSASSATPITMKLSARLNVGQWLMWMKSVT